MSVKTEVQHPGEFLVSEANGTLSREVGTVSSGQSLIDGQVVKWSTGELVAATGASDTEGNPTEDLAGIVVGKVDASAGDVKGVAYIARLAEVKTALIKRHTTTGGGAAAATAAINVFLAERFIVAR